jgi:hypothetical protein
MVKHGFILGWVIAWILVGYWKMYLEAKVSIYWTIAFFFFGLIMGTIVQTLMDKAEERRKKKDEGAEDGSVYNHRY